MLGVLATKNKTITAKSERTQEIFRGDGYVSVPDCGDDIISVCKCPNSSR